MAVDLFPIGVVIVDPHGKITHMNSAALEMTRWRDGISVDRSHLVARRQDESARLRALILGKTSSGLRVSRSGARYPYQIWVAHLSDAGSIVLIIDTERTIRGAETIVQTFYDFTPAEARLAAQLMNGCSLTEAATDLGIRLDTAKSHLKKVFSKTHTQRQSELVRLLLQSAAALRLNESSIIHSPVQFG